MSYVLVAAGFGLLLLGGEALVRGAVALAGRLGVPPLVIGITIVGFGTSTPELVTSIDAALQGAPGVAIGNVVGSNIANILLILGVGAAIRPILCDPAAFRRDGTVVVLASLGLTAVLPLGEIGRLAGLAFVTALAAYLFYTFRRETEVHDASATLHEHEAELMGEGPKSLLWSLLWTVGGIAVTLVGARLLVTGAIDLARLLGVSETVIGLTVVAVGTSLPELAATLVASLKRQGDIAFGNVIGSNIFNILGILGVTGMLVPLSIPPEVLRVDIWAMLAATALMVVFALTGLRLTRGEGWVFLAAYVAYIGLLASGVGR